MIGYDRQTLIEASLNRRTGHGSEQKAASLEAHYNAVFDWYATCPNCGERVTGSRAQLRAHVCDNSRH